MVIDAVPDPATVPPPPAALVFAAKIPLVSVRLTVTVGTTVAS